MALPLVSENYAQDRGARAPEHSPVFPLAPPVNLAKSTNFISGHPFGAYRQMQEMAPVMWHPIDGSEGFWALSRYDDVRAANLNAQALSSQQGGILMTYLDEARRHPLLHRASLDTMICLDPPHHMQLRREHMAYFTAGYTAELKKKVDIEVERLLTRAVAAGDVFDLVQGFSAELPLFTLCEILGIPEADRPKIAAWMEMLELAQYTLEQEELGNIDPAQIMQFLSEVQALFDYGQYILKARRENPQNDLLSAIANVEIEGARLPDEYLDGSWLLIVFAGNDTTRNSISGTMRLLSQFPQERRKLAADEGLFTNMTHEAIRMVSPVIYMRRTAVQPCEIRGQKIATGEKVLMYYGAANRDPRVFENPDVFNVSRTNAKDHIAFGMGPHVCLGQRVANMQLDSAYRHILGRFPNIHALGDGDGELEIAPNAFTHSNTKLMVETGKPAC
jgi:cytochrome P450